MYKCVYNSVFSPIYKIYHYHKNGPENFDFKEKNKLKQLLITTKVIGCFYMFCCMYINIYIYTLINTFNLDIILI